MEKIECKYCGKKFETNESLRQHQNDRHIKTSEIAQSTKLSIKSLKKYGIYLTVLLVILGISYGIYSLVSATYTTRAVATSVDLPNNPIHWHPNLEITIKDEKTTIPANIGIGASYSKSPHYDPMMRMTNIHTHDSSGKLHWEVMMGAPKLEDMYLGNFFQVWGKTFNSECIFEYCNGPEGGLKMFVNGKQNYEFEKYIVRDGDKIQIVYE